MSSPLAPGSATASAPVKDDPDVAAKRARTDDDDAPPGAASASPAQRPPAAPPVKAACLFCRARKSKCDGKQPCKTCIAKKQPCIYKASRRGAKRKHFDPAPIRTHLHDLLGLSNLPHNVRVPGMVPQLLSFQQPQQQQQPQSSDPNAINSFGLDAFHTGIKVEQNAQPPPPPVQPITPAQPSTLPSVSTTTAPSSTQPPPSLGFAAADTQSRPDYNALLSAPLSNMHMDGTHQGQLPIDLNTSSNSASQPLPQEQQLQLQQQLLSHFFAEGATQPPQEGQDLQMDSVMGVNPSATTAPLPGQETGSTGAAPMPAQLVSQLADQVDQKLPYGSPQAAHSSIAGAGPTGVQPTGAQGAVATPTAKAMPPFTTSGINSQALPVGASLPQNQTRARQLLVDFYLKLYAFIPVLLSPEYLETFVHFFGSHRSSFLLALECMLPLLDEKVEQEPTEGPEAFSSPARQQRRQTAAYYARLAGDAIDEKLETIDEKADWGSLLEVLQSLAVLAIYEYGSGRAVKARLKADQALGLAMSHGLHRLSSQSAFESLSLSRAPPSSDTDIVELFSSECLFEMAKRIWWVTWSLLMYASYNTGKLLTIRADDPRITSALPSGTTQPNAWIGNVLTLQTLLLVQDRVLALSQSSDAEEPDPNKTFSTSWSLGSKDAPASLAEASRIAGLSQVPSLTAPLSGPAPSADSPTRAAHNAMSGDSHGLNHASWSSASASRRQIIESMVAIDKALTNQIEQLEQQPLPWLSPDFPHKPTDLSQVENGLVAYQRLSTGLQLYTAWLTLHLYSAFQGASLFERKICFLSCVNDENTNSPSGAAGKTGFSPGSAGGAAGRPRSRAGSALSPVPIPDAYSTIFSDQGTQASNLPTSGDNTDWLTADMDMAQDFAPPSSSAGDWLLNMAGMPPLDPSPGRLQPSMWGETPNLSSSQPRPSVPAIEKPQSSDIRGRIPSAGVFDARYSLDRCVYASKRLLELISHDELKANPYPACSNVLIAFTLLMQALSVSNDLITDLVSDQGAAGADHSRTLLQSAQASAALQPSLTAEGPGTGGSGGNSREDRLAVLVDIWEKVRLAHHTLVQLAQHYDMVVPMAEEVQVCLQTSQMLFDQDALADGLYPDM